MINIFDLSTGMAGSKHRDGSPVRRSRSDVIKKPIDLTGIHRDDITIATNVKKSYSNKKSGVTPIKMLIAQELLKETEPKRRQTSIVARLMGLDDALPVQQPVLTAKRNLQEEYPRSKSAGSLRGRRQQEDVYFDSRRSREIHSCSHEKEYKDVYEVWQQSATTNHLRDHAPLKERVNQTQSEKRMALVRQSFMEAKRLATDEKLLQSKEFQDALEVLSSNRDLFLKFLDEPNSLFLKHVKELHTRPTPTKPKQTPVLKPSKTFEPNSEKHVKQCPPSSGNEWGVDKSHRVSSFTHQKPQLNEWDIDKLHRASDFTHQKAKHLSQSTRIVVLKPSPAKICNLKAIATTPISSPEFSHQGGRYGGFKTNQAVGSREMAKEITQQMQESVTIKWRDESALSNGYVGDNSSFDKSDNEYIEDVGNLSDTEIMTPTSRNSWDFNNRIGSPYSLSSFSRASCSPESSMIREAKKRLSERWAFVASNNISQEQIQVHRGSSTLGEMLAKAEVKKDALSSEVFVGEEEFRASPARLSIGCTKVVNDGESSSRALPRSKSVPVTSLAYKNIELNMEASSNQIVPIEAAKVKNGKLSFKGKVSSFFSRNKKPSKPKHVPTPLVGADDRVHSDRPESVSKNGDELSKSVNNNSDELSKSVQNNSDGLPKSDNNSSSPQESLPLNSEGQSSKTLFPGSGCDGPRKGVLSSKVALSLEKPTTSENLSKDQGKFGVTANFMGNQDQPSPISVLDAPFEDDAHNNISPCEQHSNISPCEQHSNISPCEHPQAALSRSEPIESVARTLSWDDLQLETSSTPLTLWREDGEQERFAFIQDLLSSAGLDRERVNTVFNRWHSLESPLNPLFLSNILDRKEEGAKGRQRRSSQRLLFDFVNNALLDIGHTALMNACSRKDALIASEVWGLVNVSFSSEGNRGSPDTDNCRALDRLLRKDVSGRRWVELMGMEREEVCQEIGSIISEDLIREALLDFAD